MDFYEDLNDKQKWILKYVNESTTHRVNIYNQQFVNDYIEEFKPKYYCQPFGANTVPELGRLLSDMYKKYYLLRSRIGCQGGEGFAKWVYSYYVEV
jgi:hypothetical protein